MHWQRAEEEKTDTSGNQKPPHPPRPLSPFHTPEGHSLLKGPKKILPATEHTHPHPPKEEGEEESESWLMKASLDWLINDD